MEVRRLVPAGKAKVSGKSMRSQSQYAPRLFQFVSWLVSWLVGSGGNDISGRGEKHIIGAFVVASPLVVSGGSLVGEACLEPP